MRHPKLEAFIHLFNERAFFEAHEILEVLWLETPGEQKMFYQGLIQCAVSLAHFKKDNLRGAHQVGARSFSILRNYGEVRDQICVEDLVRDCEQFLSNPGKEFPTIKTTSG